MSKEELDKIGKGIVVDEVYDFLFEGKNNEYGGEYKDFIEETEESGKMYNEKDMQSLKGVLRQFINSNGGNIDFGIAEESDIKAIKWAIATIEKFEKENNEMDRDYNYMITDLEGKNKQLNTTLSVMNDRMREMLKEKTEMEVHISDFERVVEEQQNETNGLYEGISKLLDDYGKYDEQEISDELRRIISQIQN